MSAPTKPGVPRAMISRSTSGASGPVFVWPRRRPSRPRTGGRLTTMRRSKRPGRRIAGSRTSGAVRRGDDDDAFVRLEAIHLHEELVQRSALALVVPAAEARASMTTDRVDLVDEDDARRVLLPCSKRSRTRDAPTPTNILDEVAEPEIEKNGTPASPAMARARSVLPVPGGPIMRTPFVDAAAELLELLRVLQEGDDLFELMSRASGRSPRRRRR